MTPYTIERIDDTDAVRIQVHGAVDFDTAAAIHEQLAPGGRFLHARRLWDLRGCQMALSADELKAFARMATEYDHEPARAAVLIDGDLEFGMLRIHGVYRESKFTALLVTRDESEAVTWVLGDLDAN